MKEKRLDCEKARNIDIVSTLANLGHFPVRKTEKEAWFLSPLRKETQASFKVSLKQNYWIDFGTFEGGSTIDLVMKMENCSVKEALERLSGNTDHFSFHRQPVPNEKKDGESQIEIIEVKEIEHRALQDYLQSRKISTKTARKLCKEVHYEIGGRKYFAIGLWNRSGGWELRNSYWKGSTSPKDVSMMVKGSKKLAITEGMFDMLTLIELKPDIGNSHDLLVLNTTAFVKRMITEIGEYENVELFLDRDKTGLGMMDLLLEKCPNSRDMSFLYEGFKDMNEWKVKSGKDEVRQRIQDVSLS
ncbi:CHC2 zinc finger domain-containing protein [Maribacter sp. PR1]|uniref:Toprim domain-containing protein n=1 Tax=Maribacter cobaltidurans TaxID=1178778 RepID=A0ABU7IQZ3_9FLAO|nr:MULTISPECIES: toprim domain-containing protein [Maribacter]MDC6387895.1 CHC2 zinc finger domain-containing protein [Maribacter sp. PR1]MEE1975284.1 toprim domain-containing protein [Maribacter cobaltidurans]